MNEKMLTSQEVAARLKRSARTIQKYCDRGIFPGAKKSGPFERSGWLIPESAVKSFEETYPVK